MELRLLVPTADTTQRHLTLPGKRWVLSNPFELSGEIPEYACVSYIWGSGRAANIFHPSSVTSDRTVPSLSAAMQSTTFEAYWIDAFCIPPHGIQRRSTLESMGFIYNHAACVGVALSERTMAAVERLKQWDPSTAADDSRILDDMEAEPWIRSVWTYQEVINSKELLLVSPDYPRTAIDQYNFLNILGRYLSKYQPLTPYELSKAYPHVDAFQELIADWYISDYLEVSALRILSGMHRREWIEPKNYFYSMIGVVTQLPSSRPPAPTVEGLSEVFMSLCEEKGDFSFIYSAAERDSRPGYRWRPRPGILPSILPWHHNKGWQPARKDGGKVYLQEMLFVDESPSLGANARRFIARLFNEELLDRDENDIAAAVYLSLQSDGFTGNKEAVTTARGLFFPQKQLPSESQFVIAVNPSLEWRFGAPGIAKWFDDSQTHAASYTPGVFVGHLYDSRGGEEEMLLD